MRWRRARKPMHPCVPGCRIWVRWGEPFCREHWRLVPKAHRFAVRETWRRYRVAKRDGRIAEASEAFRLHGRFLDAARRALLDLLDGIAAPRTGEEVVKARRCGGWDAERMRPCTRTATTQSPEGFPRCKRHRTQAPNLDEQEQTAADAA